MAITPAQLNYIRKLLAQKATGRAAVAISKIHPADIADLFSVSLTPSETRMLVDLLFNQLKAGDVLSELPDSLLTEVLDELDDGSIARILKRQDPNDALQFLSRIEPQRHEPILNLLPGATRYRIEQLLIYPEDSSGQYMASSYMSILPDITASEAVERIRGQSEDVDVPFYVYVTDEDRRLLGVVPLRRLVTCPPDTSIRELMVEDPFTVDATDDREEAAAIARKYDIMAVPVVDDNHHLLGVIPGDSLFDVLEKEATEDMFRMAGLSEEDSVFTPVPTAFRQRFPWILVNLVTAFVASTVVRAFEGTIAQVATIAAFMPVVAGMGGNIGNQSLVVITRAIALGELDFSSAGKAIMKESSLGLLMGLVAGTVASVVAFTTAGDTALALRLGLVILISMVANMGLAGLLGAGIPLTLRAMGRDPALGSNILLTACTDSIGYLLLLGLAMAMIT
ncbi:MAG TPA: magnesium transporter [Candidatus Sabulitectum sp.]|nr:magnesium transporter [Candidatus Sabulitectum sp.]HPR21547.1 magnesium transporter [Candidatus Sabulitectum sp.]